MADIAAKVAQIRQAVYGKEVRESIASGIEAINSEVVSTTGRQNVIDGQESTRINNENTRISNDASRTTSENTRISNETNRISNENTRIINENNRQSQETTRQNIFVTNEDIRYTSFNANENDRSTQFNGLKTEIIESINDAHEAVIHTNLATSNYTTVVEQTRKIYKPAVDTFSDLSVQYPNPEIGWTVTSKDSNIEYRWDGIEWMYIGSGDSSIGYGIVVGSIAPSNSNTIWLDAPENTRYAKIVPSVTEPIEVGQIWWELDD